MSEPTTKAGQWLVNRSRWDEGMRGFFVRINATAGPEDMLVHALAIEKEAIVDALQAVWDIGDELDSNHARWAASTVADRMGVKIRIHNDFSDPPRNLKEEFDVRP